MWTTFRCWGMQPPAFSPLSSRRLRSAQLNLLSASFKRSTRWSRWRESQLTNWRSKSCGPRESKECSEGWRRRSSARCPATSSSSAGTRWAGNFLPSKKFVSIFLSFTNKMLKSQAGTVEGRHRSRQDDVSFCQIPSRFSSFNLLKSQDQRSDRRLRSVDCNLPSRRHQKSCSDSGNLHLHVARRTRHLQEGRSFEFVQRADADHLPNHSCHRRAVLSVWKF